MIKPPKRRIDDADRSLISGAFEKKRLIPANEDWQQDCMPKQNADKSSEKRTMYLSKIWQHRKAMS
jgi:hypothetical protein